MRIVPLIAAPALVVNATIPCALAHDDGQFANSPLKAWFDLGGGAMPDNVVRFCDYDKRSKQPDAAQPRDPAEADVIILPVVRRFVPQERPHDAFPSMPWSQ